MKGIINLIRNFVMRRNVTLINSEFENLEYKNSRNLEERYLLDKLFMGKK